MDPETDGGFEVVPVACFACAARDAEERHASELIDGGMNRSAFDGIYFAVQERRE